MSTDREASSVPQSSVRCNWILVGIRIIGVVNSGPTFDGPQGKKCLFFCIIILIPFIPTDVFFFNPFLMNKFVFIRCTG